MRYSTEGSNKVECEVPMIPHLTLGTGGWGEVDNLTYRFRGRGKSSRCKAGAWERVVACSVALMNATCKLCGGVKEEGYLICGWTVVTNIYSLSRSRLYSTLDEDEVESQ